MKAYFLFLVVFLISWAGIAQEGYRVEGHIPGIADGELYLVLPTTEGVRTLGTTNLKGGVFTFEGKVEDGCVALLKTAGRASDDSRDAGKHVDSSEGCGRKTLHHGWRGTTIV